MKTITKLKGELWYLKEIMTQLNSLKNEINAKYYNKSIEFEGNFIVDEDGFNFRIQKVIPEENVVEISYDVFEKDEQIKCTEFISIEQFMRYAK